MSQIVTVGDSNAISFGGVGSKLIARNQITNLTGRIIAQAHPVNHVQDAGISLSKVEIEFPRGGYEYTGILNAEDGERLTLTGNETVYGGVSTQIAGINVRGTGNHISGAIFLTDDLTLATANDAVKLSLSSDMTGAIILNGGTIELAQPLVFAQDARLTGSGTVNCANNQITFGPGDTQWTGTWTFVDADRISLQADADCSGTLNFSGSGPAVLNGNGHTLDLSMDGTLALRAGQSLLLEDITIKGLGSEGASGRGSILFEDSLSTLSLHNVTIHMGGNFTVTVGSWYVKDANSHLIAGSNLLTFDQNATLSIDGVYFTYDPLGASDNNNVRPSSADGIHRVDLNGGRATIKSAVVEPNNLLLDNDEHTLSKDQLVHAGDPLHFRGLSASAITLDGNGQTLDFARSSGDLLKVFDNKSATLTNITLKNFKPEHLVLGSNAQLTLGDRTYIYFSDNADLNYTLTCDGLVTFRGFHTSLSIVKPFGGFLWNSGSNIVFEDLYVKNCGGSALNPYDATTHCIVRDTTLAFDTNQTFSIGSLDIAGSSIFTSSWATISYTSSSDLTIQSGSKLFLDRGITFSYDSAAASRTGLAFEDASSEMVLCGASLHTTLTGLDLVQGRMKIDETVTVSCEASNNAEAVRFGDEFDLYITAGGTLRIFGRVVHG
jgi:hypothetical protein